MRTCIDFPKKSSEYFSVYRCDLFITKKKSGDGWGLYTNIQKNALKIQSKLGKEIEARQEYECLKKGKKVFQALMISPKDFTCFFSSDNPIDPDLLSFALQHTITPKASYINKINTPELVAIVAKYRPQFLRDIPKEHWTPEFLKTILKSRAWFLRHIPSENRTVDLVDTAARSSKNPRRIF
ncbi:MAG: hypothetical protein ACOYK9_05685 [Chlamydiia bacterium]